MLAVIEWSDGSRGVVEKSPCVVGKEGDVRVSRGGVSRRHAELRVVGDAVRLVDLGSTYGTTVGGQKVEAGVEVSVGWGEEVLFAGKYGFKLLRPEKSVALRVVEPEDEWSLATVEQAAKSVPKSRRGRRPGLTLSERDLGVLEWIAEHRWSTRELIIEALYSKPNPEKMRPGVVPSGKYGRGRVAELERAGFIHPSVIKIGATVPLLLTPKGYDILHGQGRAEWAHPFPDIDASRFSHELLLQRLRISLVKLGAKTWISERRLSQVNRRSGLAYVPDARFDASGRQFSLEFERTLKAKKKLHEFLKVRAEAKPARKMLYVLPARLIEPFQKAIADSWSQFPAGLYVLTAEDFSNKKKSLMVQCLNSQWRTMLLADLIAGKPEPSEVDAANKAAEQARLAKMLAQEKQRMRQSIEEMVTDFFAHRQALIDVMVENHKGKDKLLYRKKPVPTLTLPKHYEEVMSWAERAGKLGSVDAVTAFKKWAEHAVSRLNWEVENHGAISSKELLNSPTEKALLDWAKGG